MEPPSVKWLHPFADIFVGMLPDNCGKVLDVGCGRGIVGSLIGTYRGYDEIMGLDGFEPYVKWSREIPFYRGVYVVDVSKGLSQFRDSTFDLAVCLEVLEHLYPPDSYHLIQELQRVAKKVIISTPNNFSQQPAYDSNELQHHRCLYSAKQLQNRGFKVSFVRVGRARIVFRGRRLPRIASSLSNGFLLGEWSR